MEKKHGLTGKPSNRAGKPLDDKRTVYIHVKCYVDEKKRYQDAAEKEGTDLSKFTRSALDEKVKANKEKAARGERPA